MAQNTFYHVETKAKRLTSEEVTDLAIDSLQNHFQLDLGGSLYRPEHIWSVVLAAATEGIAMEGACALFRDVPSPNTVRNRLKELFGDEQELESFEESMNQMLLSQLPPVALIGRPLCAADVTQRPYHGEYDEEDELYVRRSKAKSGTSHFYEYASLYITTRHKRYTVAITLLRRSDLALDGLKRLMKRAEQIGLTPDRLLLDREYDNNSVIRWLKKRRHESIMPLKIQGKTGGTRTLLETRKSYKTRYTRNSEKYGRERFPVWVVCRYQNGKYGEHGMVKFAYVVIGQVKMSFKSLYEEYRKRFGIECSYRMAGEVWAKTTSKNVLMRMFLTSLGFMLLNLHSKVKWEKLYFEGKPGRRQILHGLLPLHKFRIWIFDVLKQRRGFADQIVILLSSDFAVY